MFYRKIVASNKVSFCLASLFDEGDQEIKNTKIANKEIFVSKYKFNDFWMKREIINKYLFFIMKRPIHIYMGGVRKPIHQSWLAKKLGLRLLCWGFKGVQEEIPSEEASTLQNGSVGFPPGQCTSPQLHPWHKLFDQDGHQDSSSPSLLSRPYFLWLLVIP